MGVLSIPTADPGLPPRSSLDTRQKQYCPRAGGKGVHDDEEGIAGFRGNSEDNRMRPPKRVLTGGPSRQSARWRRSSGCSGARTSMGALASGHGGDDVRVTGAVSGRGQANPDTRQPTPQDDDVLPLKATIGGPTMRNELLRGRSRALEANLTKERSSRSGPRDRSGSPERLAPSGAWMRQWRAPGGT
jgi:hypothetical protein